MKTKADKTDNNPLQNINKTIHEPARLNIMSNLYVVESADFIYLMRTTGLTDGNLSAHIKKLSTTGYIKIRKEFKNNRPLTTIFMTDEGKSAFEQYMADMKSILNNITE